MTPKQNQKRNEELEKMITDIGWKWFDSVLDELHRWVEGEFPEREYPFNKPEYIKSRKKLLKLMEIDWVEKKLKESKGKYGK